MHAEMLLCWQIGPPSHDFDALSDGVCAEYDLLDVFVVDFYTGLGMHLTARRLQALVPCQASTLVLH